MFKDPQGNDLLYDGCNSDIALSVARCHPDGLITFYSQELETAYRGIPAEDEQAGTTPLKGTSMDFNERTSKRLNAICKAHTAFESFADLLDAKGGYYPSINVRDAGPAARDMAFLAKHYDLEQARRGDPRRANVTRSVTPLIVTPVSRKVSGPGGLNLIIDLDDPDTPAMVYDRNQRFGATWECATQTGELAGFRDASSSIEITQAQSDWLEAFADEVEAAYAKARSTGDVEINEIRQGSIEVGLTRDAYDYNDEFYTLEVTEFDGDGKEGVDNDADISGLPISASAAEKRAYLIAAMAVVQAKYGPESNIRRTASPAAKAGIEAVAAIAPAPAAKPRP